MVEVRPSPAAFPETLKLRVLDGVNVVFGPGLEVQNIKTSFESRTIVIRNVPSKITVGEITDTLRPFGEVLEVRLPDAMDQPKMTVKATLSTYDEASQVVARLDNERAFGATLQVQLASQHTTALGKGLVHDGDVRLQFPAPCCTGYAGYATKDAAQRAIIAAKEADLGDCEIHAVMHHGLPNLGPYNVKFLGLPPDVSQKDVESFGQGTATMLEKPNYHSIRDAAKELLYQLEKSGEVSKLTILGPPFPRQTVIAWAHFKSPASADRACRFLHNRRQLFIGNEYLKALHNRTITYTVPKEVWDAIGADVGNLQRQLGYGNERGYILVSDWRRRFDDANTVSVKLISEQLPILARLKTAFEGILRGEKLEVEGQNLWDPFFGRSGGAGYLQQLQRDHPGILINRDPQKRCISLFGPPEARYIVRFKLLQKFEFLRAQKVHTFPLDGRLIGLFVNADLLKLQQELGHENVILDFSTRTLQVRGGRDALQATQLILRHTQERHVSQRKRGAHDCPVCLGDVSLPVSLPCGHTWCMSCLVNFLTSAVSTRLFPLTCLGDEGRCNHPIPVSIAKDILTPDQFSEVTHASFLSYIHSRPSEFFYCPTPDCPQIYRTAPPDTILQCPSCLVRICGNCHVESHEGTTCAKREFEDQKLFKEWSKWRDVKNCPGCKAPIERIAGCNHIMCTHCKTHICWACLATFEKSGEVYAHMTDVHGGNGLEVDLLPF
jgi:hypothetical protein